MRDFSEVKGSGKISHQIADEALKMLEIDDMGLDETDRKLLYEMINHFDGGPVGLSSIAAILSEEVDTIADVYEPFLIQEGFLKRTKRGRVATLKAYEHLNLEYNEEPKLKI